MDVIKPKKRLGPYTYVPDDGADWEATPVLRFVLRSGKKVLQQRFLNRGQTPHFRWYDVPLYTEEGKQ